MTPTEKIYLEAFILLVTISVLILSFSAILTSIIYTTHKYFVCVDPKFQYIRKIGTGTYICLSSDEIIVNSSTVYQFAIEESDLQKNAYYKNVGINLGISAGVLGFVGICLCLCKICYKTNRV